MKFWQWYRRIPLFYLNLGAFILGCVAGLCLYKLGEWRGRELLTQVVSVISPFGLVLVNMLKMIVIPIIFLSLVHGAASLPTRTFGKLGIGVCLWYLFTSVFAAFFGTGIAMVFNPSLKDASALVSPDMIAQVGAFDPAAARGGNMIIGVVLNCFANPFKALANGDFLAVIVFSLLFGAASRVVLDCADNERTRRIVTQMLELCEAALQAVFKIVEWVMAYFPVGIFALTACNFAAYGVSLFSSYLQVASCVICGILLMIFVCYPLFIAAVCRINPFPVLWRIREPMLTAFVTRSSAATLPVSMRTAREELHVRGELAGFSLSLGATINMDGVCVHLPAFAVFAANIFGCELTMGRLLAMVLCVVFASVGAGGVPGGSIFLLFMVLGNFALTPEQMSLVIALALGINPLLDMFETACNVAGDNIGTYIIGRRSGMIDRE